MNTEETEEKRKKIKELKKSYEQIISLFADSEGGLSTREVYEGMVELFEFDKSLKTIENYLKDLQRGHVSGVELTWINRGKHQLVDHRDITERQMEQHMEKLHSKKVLYGEEKAYMRLAMESIRKLDTLSTKHHSEIEGRLGLQQGMEASPYFIDNEDMESVDMSDVDIIHLKEAIVKDAIVEFRYTGKSRKEWYVVEPYKLIIFDGLWYLFGKDTADSDTPYKTWRLVHIKDVDYDRSGQNTHNMDDSHSESILKEAEDARFVVDETESKPVIRKDITVMLRISPEIDEHFDHEAHIPGVLSDPLKQKDGTLLLTTKVNSFNDIESEIKSWLPHIEVLEPQEYREKLLLDIEKFREKMAGGK